ncbi:MAG: hypothetical protein RLZZ458_981 [Planctomycetota bacterium]
MFVAAGEPIDGVDVHAAFVREGTLSDEGLSGAEVEVGEFVDVSGEFRESLDTAVAEDSFAEFQGEVGGGRDEVGIAAAFADAVDSALDLYGAGVDSGERVGDGEVAVVVAVDADRHLDMLLELTDEVGDLFRKRATVCIAHDDHICPGSCCGFQRLQGVVGVGFPAVEAVFSVINGFAAMGFHEADAVVDHGEVFFEGHAEHFGDVQVPCFTDDGADGCAGIDEGLHADVLRSSDSFAASHSEGADFGVLQWQFGDTLEVFFVFGIGEWVATFDVVESEFIESAGDGQLVLQREVDAFALRAVAEGGVVELDAGHGRVLEDCWAVS